MKRAPLITASPTACLALALTGTLIGAAPLLADEPEVHRRGASYRQVLDCPQKPKAFDPFELTWLTEPEAMTWPEHGVRCVTRASSDGVGQKGVKVTLEGEIVDPNNPSFPVETLPRQTKRTNGAGYALHEFPALSLAATLNTYVANMKAEIKGGKNKAFASLETECESFHRKGCMPDADTACLLDRFRVEIEWRSQTASGPALLSAVTNNSAEFYFLNPASPDLLVRLLDQCGENDHFWVFTSPSTPLGFEIAVTDTVAGDVQKYIRNLGQSAPAVTDTSAFSTCP